MYIIIKQYSFSNGDGLWLAPAFFRIFEESDDLAVTTLLCLKFILIVGLLLLLMMKSSFKRYRVNIVIMAFFLVGFWGWNLKDLDKDYLYYQNKFEKECREICEKISEINKDVYYDGEDCNEYRIKEMQFMANEVQFKMINSEEIVKTSNKLILMNKNGRNAGIIDMDIFNVKYENEVWILIEKTRNGDQP